MYCESQMICKLALGNGIAIYTVDIMSKSRSRRRRVYCEASISRICISMPSRCRLWRNGSTYWKLLPLSSINSKVNGWPVFALTNFDF